MTSLEIREIRELLEQMNCDFMPSEGECPPDTGCQLCARRRRVLFALRIESSEDLFDHYIRTAIASSPEPVQELGEFLTSALSEDEWPTAERLLNQICTQSGRAPEGWTLAPERMHLDLNAMRSLLDVTGETFTEEEFPECILWIGETADRNGDEIETYYGLNVMMADYPEEGSTPIIEFDRPEQLTAGPSSTTNDQP